MTTETKWHLPPPSAGIGITNTAVSLSTVDACHILHLPLLNMIICFTFGRPLLKPNHAQWTVKHSLPYLPFPPFNNEPTCDASSGDSFARLPVCRLIHHVQPVRSVKVATCHRSGSSGVSPIVPPLTWSMWLIVFARGCKRGGVGTAGPTTH